MAMTIEELREWNKNRLGTPTHTPANPRAAFKNAPSYTDPRNLSDEQRRRAHMANVKDWDSQNKGKAPKRIKSDPKTTPLIYGSL